MRNARGREVVGLDGLRGRLVDGPPDARTDRPVRVELEDGQRIDVPSSMLRQDSGGRYRLSLSRDELDRLDARRHAAADGEETVVPVLAEELVVDKERVPTGGVRVHRRIEEHEELVDIPLLKEHVDVRRVLIDREVDGPLPIRREGDLTIVPVVEEVLVVQKRFRLKEEIHISRQVREERHQERVVVRRQEAEVEQLDDRGRGTPVQPAVREETTPRRTRRKSLLGP